MQGLTEIETPLPFNLITPFSYIVFKCRGRIVGRELRIAHSLLSYREVNKVSYESNYL
jgi:hypothetical protein